MAGLPITHITLFWSGRAHVRRWGSLASGAPAEFPLNPSVAQDVLRTLRVQSEHPVHIHLVDSPAQSSTQAVRGGSQIMRWLRGAEVAVTSGNDSFTGVLAGDVGDPANVGSSGMQLMLLTEAGVRLVPFGEVRTLSPNTPEGHRTLRRYRDSIVDGTDRAAPILRVEVTSKKAAAVSIEYIEMARPWSTSYRLVVANKSSTLQAWLHVTNAGDEDWEDVQLELVARPRAPQPSKESTPGDLASAGDARYLYTEPATVRANSTTLLPVTESPVSTTEAHVFRSDQDVGVLRGFTIQNDSDTTLEAGPVVVFRDTDFAGEAVLPQVAPHGEVFLTTGPSDQCHVETASEVTLEDVHAARVVSGRLSLSRFRVARTVYHASCPGEGVDLLIEHRFRAGWELVESPAPVLKMDGAYRFQLEVPPRDSARLQVTERELVTQSFAVEHVRRTQIGQWCESRYIDSKTRSAISTMISLGDALEELEQRTERSEVDLRDVLENQKRLRKNLQLLGDSKEEQALRTELALELKRDEERLRRVRRHLRELRKAHGSSEKALREQAKGLSFQANITLLQGMPPAGDLPRQE